MDGSWLLIIAAILGAVLLGVWLLFLAIGLAVHSIAVAVNLFAWASQSGFVGVALYVMLWVVATPVMIAVCIIGGVIRALSEWAGSAEATGATHAARRDPERPGLDSVEYLDWANRRGKWADDRPNTEPW